MSLSGPEHLAHRAALNACFRPRAVNGYREQILRATAVRYIDAIRDRGQADANTEILERISMRAIGDVLGFTDVHDDILIRWFRGFAAYLVDFGRSSEVAEHGRAIKAELAADLRTRLDSLAAHPDASTVSHLLHDGMPSGMPDGITRGIEEIIGDIGVMIVGGFQEPAHGAANSLHFCLGHFVACQLEQVMLEEMFARLPNLRPDPDREATVHGWAVRAAKRLPVVWDA